MTHAEPQSASPAATPSTSFYGWIIVAALAVTETVSWGIVYYAIAVLLRPMEAELGWSRGALSGAFSLALIVSAVAAIPVGRWLDTRGGRGLMTAGSVLATLLLVAWSRVDRLETYYVIWAGLGLAMAALLYEPAFAIVANWFVRLRVRALTIVTLAGGLASTIFLPLASWLVGRYGWRDALVALAILLGAVTIPLHALVLRRHPRDLGLQPDGAVPALAGAREDPIPPDRRAVPAAGEEARGAARPASAPLRTRAFWALAAAFVLSAAATAVVGVHFIPHLIDRGLDPGFAAWAAGLIGVMQVVGRLGFGPLSARLPRTWIAAAIFLLPAAALWWLPGAARPIDALVVAALFGMGNGMITLARASRVAEIFGARRYGTLSGVIAFGATMARAAGPAVAGWGYDRLGGYTEVFRALAVLTVAAAICALVAERAAACDDRATEHST